MLHRIDADQKLYWLKHGDGYTALGFDVAKRWAIAVAAFAGVAAPVEAEGTAEAYAEYERIMAAGAAHAAKTGTRDNSDLTPQLVGLEGKRVEVVMADGEVSRFWVGKSMGWRPVHLAIASRRSSGGPAVYGAPFKSVRVLSKENRR